MENSDEIAAVKISVRVRPYIGVPQDETDKVIYDYSPADKILIIDDRPFVFDNVLGPEVNQEELYEALIQPLVVKTVEGFHCTAFAYGQTGTGKTYTMGLHTEVLEGKNAGMISRAVDDIFARIFALNQEEIVTNISVSFIEIYNEKVFDLLSINFSEAVNTKGCKFPGGTKKVVSNPNEAIKVLIDGNKNRHVRSTKINPCSSRSHAIFTIYTGITNRNTNTKTYSAFNLVDLAGSEGVRRTGHQGLAMAEGVHINQGLLCVSKVLQALSSGSKVIPYRDSVLSTVLQDSLNSNSYLTLLACVSPSKVDLSETLSTLRFAQNTKSLKNQPKINAILAEIKKRAKTPTKVFPPLRSIAAFTPTPMKLPFTNFTSTVKRGTIMQHNTFCTPSKMRVVDHRKNYTMEIETNKNRLLSPPDISILEMNDSVPSSRESLWNFDVSTSTTIDAMPPPVQSSSPLFRQFSDRLESLINTKLQSFLDNLQNSTFAQNQTVIDKTTVQNNNYGTTQNLSQKNFISNDPGSTDQQSSVKQDNNFKIPIFKPPPTYVNNPPETATSLYQPNSTTFIDDSTTEPNYAENTVINVPVIDTTQIECIPVALPLTRRRSERLSIRRKTVDDIKDFSQSEKSYQKTNENFTSRISSNETKNNDKSSTRKRKTTKNIDVYEKYFVKPNTTNKSQSKKNKKSLHRENILNLINKGNVKEIQFLPEIGLKTSYLIVTHRTINGSFKTFEELSKLPVWKGKKWDRFITVNNLD